MEAVGRSSREKAVLKEWEEVRVAMLCGGDAFADGILMVFKSGGWMNGMAAEAYKMLLNSD